MWRSTAHSLTLLCLWVCLNNVHGAGGKPCVADQYYQQSTDSCLSCSRCSDNEVIRKPCSHTTDTVCGPFKEFKFFQHRSESDPEEEKSLQHVGEKTELHLTIYSEGSAHSRRNVAMTESEESKHWRTVAFALIGALSALVFLGTLIVLVTCRRINQSRTPPIQRTDEDDADCPYVVIHTIRPSASDDEATYQVPPGPNALHQLARQRQRLYKYHPKRRLLQANEYADDVFESEDSAGSRRRISLQAIPETDHSESETECSPLPSLALPLASSDFGDTPIAPSADQNPLSPDPVSPSADKDTPSPDPVLPPTDQDAPSSHSMPAMPTSGQPSVFVKLIVPEGYEESPLPTETSVLLKPDTPAIPVS